MKLIEIPDDVRMECGLPLDLLWLGARETHETTDEERDEYRRMELDAREDFEREYYGDVDPQEWSLYG